ncbi:pyridoxamine 5'-phosphate oxidase family protein [Streptomyces sp. NPDC085479]|uniref:pyridoxamine 5'-phosphate oxidase family protein n=1 Tax=Streptomyces sp. NPDC085479 TaxID=3365726 RepID=UPI0037D0EA0B
MNTTTTATEHLADRAPADRSADRSPADRTEGRPSAEASPEYTPTDRTVPTRARQRASYDRALVHAILDEGYVCHLGFIRDGAPVVLPTLYGRIGERLYVHGSTGSRPLRMAAHPKPAPAAPAGAGTDATATATSPDRAEAPGLPVCLTVTHVDGLVLARSAFHHSLNYRSVVVHGTAHQVTDPEELRTALDALVDQVVPGRAADSRPANAKELAATAVLRLDLEEVSAKVRDAGPNDDAEDLALPHWAGVVPVAPHTGLPVPSADLDPSIALPAYLTAR